MTSVLDGTSVIDRYLNGEGCHVLGRAYDVSPTTITRFLRRSGCRIRGGQEWRGRMFASDANAKIQAAYLAGENTSTLARQYGVQGSSIVRRLRRMGVQMRDQSAQRRAIWPLREDAFATLTDEAAYWIGFLYADGYLKVDGVQQRLKLALCEKDIEHLRKFRRFLGAERNKIHVFPPGRQSYSTGNYVEFTVSSPQLVADLAKHGMGKKSLDRVAPPELASCPHFWRGVVDGDGTVLACHGKPTLKLCGGKRLLGQFAGFARRICDGKFRLAPDRMIWAVGVAGKPAAVLIQHLYGTGGVSLDRKQQVAERFCK